MTTYLAIGRKKCRPPRTSILLFYVSNRIALDFGTIFLEIEANRIVSYCPAIAQAEMRLILTPFHLRPLSAGTRRARLETQAEARTYHRPQTARRHSPPRRLAAARSAPVSRAATEPQHRLYRPQNGSCWGLDAHSLRAPRGGHAGGPVPAARACCRVSIVTASSSSRG
jgi:hypothetical protein